MYAKLSKFLKELKAGKEVSVLFKDNDKAVLYDYEKFTKRLGDFTRFVAGLDKTQAFLTKKDYIKDIKLVLCHRSLGAFSKYISFDENFLYDIDESEKFRNLVMEKKAYLHDDSNFFDIPDALMSNSRRATGMKEARVILFWRNCNLSEMKRKWILTLGFLFLTDQISQAELVTSIDKVLPKGTFEVNIRSEPNNYVRIGIEPPILV